MAETKRQTDFVRQNVWVWTVFGASLIRECRLRSLFHSWYVCARGTRQKPIKSRFVLWNVNFAWMAQVYLFRLCSACTVRARDIRMDRHNGPTDAVSRLKTNKHGSNFDVIVMCVVLRTSCHRHRRTSHRWIYRIAIFCRTFHLLAPLVCRLNTEYNGCCCVAVVVIDILYSGCNQFQNPLLANSVFIAICMHVCASRNLQFLHTYWLPVSPDTTRVNEFGQTVYHRRNHRQTQTRACKK